jgi:hypothetical protein
MSGAGARGVKKALGTQWRMVVPRQADGMNVAAAYIGGTDLATSARRAVTLAGLASFTALGKALLVGGDERASARLAAG